MQVVSVHSHKGGAGKTALSLMMARRLAEQGHKVCVLDLDFVGAGIWPAIGTTVPTRYIEEVLTAAAGSGSSPPVEDLVVEHRLEPPAPPISLILNTGSPTSLPERKRSRLHDQALGLLELERQAGVIEQGLKDLMPCLEEAGFDHVILDCHPTLEEISEAVFRVQMAQPKERSSVVLMASADRADLYGLLREVNRRTKSRRDRTLRLERTVLVINRVEPVPRHRPYLTDLATVADLASELARDPLVGEDAPTLLHVLQPPHYCRILWNRGLSSAAFAVGSSGEIPCWPPGLLNHSGTPLCEQLFGPC